MSKNEINSEWKKNTTVLLVAAAFILGILLYISLLDKQLGIEILSIVAIMAIPIFLYTYLQVFVVERDFDNQKTELVWKVVSLIILWCIIPFFAFLLILLSAVFQPSSGSPFVFFVSIMVVATFWLVEKATVWTISALRLYKDLSKVKRR